jgi:hypothetical protein
MKEYELRGNTVIPSDDGRGAVEHVGDIDATFWSVYETARRRTWVWLADFSRREDAEKWKAVMEKEEQS